MWLGNTMGLAARWALLLHLACGLQALCAALAPHCSRAASRDVLRVVQQILLPDGQAGNLLAASASSCPLLGPDRYQAQEGAKEPLAEGRWRCRLDGKRFLEEGHLDAHLARRHAHLDPGPANATCLADWHAALHAQHLAAYLDGAPGWAADPLPCRTAAAAAARAACLTLADACLPPGGEGGAPPSLAAMHRLLAQQLCQAHTCDKRRKRQHLHAVAKAHRRQQGGWTALEVGTAGLVLTAFWLLLWLVQSEGGSKSRVYRRLASVRRRLEAAAEGGAGLATVLRSVLAGVGAKHHAH